MEPNKNGFTLIELLVVIAVIAVLMGILTPVLRKARSQARMAYCAAHLRQIGVGVGIYQSEMGKDKIWEAEKNAGQTADFAHEYCGGNSKGGNGAINRYLVDRFHILPDRELFFCPSMANLSHKVNYTWRQANQQVTPEEIHLSQLCTWCQERGFPEKHFRFWSSYAWIWRKQVIPGGLVTQVNSLSKKVLMFDQSPSQWIKTDRLLGATYTGFGVHQALEHYNALMLDGHVERPAMSDRDMNLWLWGQENWPGEAPVP